MLYKLIRLDVTTYYIDLKTYYITTSIMSAQFIVECYFPVSSHKILILKLFHHLCVNFCNVLF